MPPTYLADLKKSLATFKTFLVARGAELFEPASQYEVLRFKSGTTTSIIYVRNNGKLTFTGESAVAWYAYKHQHTWRAIPATKRRNAPTPAIATLRKRDGDNCFYCLQSVNEETESEEHLVARTHQGPDNLYNKVLAHRVCNSLADHLSLMEKINIHVTAKLKQQLKEIHANSTNRIDRRILILKRENQTIASAIAILERRLEITRPSLNSPQDMVDYLRLTLAQQKVEVFGMLFFNNELRLLKNKIICTGTVAHCAVYPREVVRAAMEENAVSVVIYHNHPNGAAIPSPSDIRLTETLKTALATIDVKLLDHIIIALTKVYFFAENGKL